MTHERAARQQNDAAIKTMPFASVIVPAYNSQATIARCLAALERQTLPRQRYEIIVVDDGSKDGTCAIVGTHADVKLVTQPHAGPAAARNLGVAHALGQVVLFTDADCEPAADWIEQMLAPLADPQTAGVKGVYRNRQRALVSRFVQMEYETRYERMARYMSRHGRIDFVDTYAAGYRRTVFVANGGFDTTFATASVEDQEFSFRVAAQGDRLVFAPQAVVYHWGHAATLSAYARKKFKIGYHKVQVLARHTDKAWQDAHTPQNLKAQMLIAGLGMGAFLGSLVWHPLVWAAAGLGGLFVATTLAFVVKAWNADPCVAIVAPFLFLVRALALGSGLATGIVSHLVRRAAGLVTCPGIGYHENNPR